MIEPTITSLPAGPLLADVVDISLFAAMIDGRYINIRSHPAGTLHICDYAQAAQYDRVWNPVTMLCRGLIVDQHPLEAGARIVARPFRKFANLSEHAITDAFGTIPVGARFDVFAKMDGSLAICYPHPDGLPAISTRGSFESTQALDATRLLRDRYAGFEPPHGATMLFEYIAPWNRVVVDYGDTYDLFALACIDNHTGADLPIPDTWPGPRVERFDRFATLDDLNQAAAGDDVAGVDAEGFVIRFHAEPGCESMRTKVKYADYLRLHHAATELTSVAVWRHLRNGGTATELAELVPDEFHPSLHAMVDSILDAYQARWDQILTGARAIYARHSHLLPDRAAYVAAVKAEQNRDADVVGAAYALVDNPDNDQPEWRIAKKMWRTIKPVYNPMDRVTTFFSLNDDEAGFTGDAEAA